MATSEGALPVAKWRIRDWRYFPIGADAVARNGVTIIYHVNELRGGINSNASGTACCISKRRTGHRR
jgi:hypothetical protein